MLAALGLCTLAVVGRDGGAGPHPRSDAAAPAAVAPRVRYKNGFLALVEHNELAVVRPDGTGLRKLTACPSSAGDCDFASYAWSPDGKQLAFVGGRMGGALNATNTYLYVVQPDGTGRRRLAHCGCGFGPNLSWSPDGRSIAFSGGYGVDVVDVATGVQRTVSTIGASPAWSPDGSAIAFASGNSLFTVRPDGSNVARIAGTDSEVSNPAWSPDATVIAFDAGDELYTIGADGRDLRRLFGGAPGSGPASPSWSPDGSRVAFFSTPRGAAGFGAEVWVARRDGTDRRLLYRSDSVGVWSAPVWSPDGKLIASGPHAESEILLFGADGTFRRRLPGYARVIAWQPLPRR